MTNPHDVHAINCTGKIDNISIVLGGYGPEYSGSYESKLIQFANLGILKPTKAARNGFARNYKLLEDMFNSRVLISAKPIKPNGPTLRLEFNPARLEAQHTAQVIEWIAEEILFEGYKEFYERARVTRFDVAFDLFGFSMGQAHFWSDKVTSSQTYNALGMRTQTCPSSGFLEPRAA